MADKQKQKQMSLAKHNANYFNLEHIGWKYYNTIRKKAMEQEFSWSGLLISLSIAFFIVTASALFLNFIFNSVETNKQHQRLVDKNIHNIKITINNNLS
jgi:hypothetical protein